MISDTELNSLGRILASQVRNDSSKPFYDLMSGAIVWTDEVVLGLPPDQMLWLRLLFRCRTNLILSEPDEKLAGICEAFQAACPGWIGFSPERYERNEDLVNTVRELKRKGERRTAPLFRARLL